MISLWLDEADRLGEEDSPRLEGEERADVCIVGGGYTGLWTAIRLKDHDPSLDVVVVEGRTCGWGPSGRNGGFVLSWWTKFPKFAHALGADDALWLVGASAEAVDEIGAFCQDNGIDAHFRRDGWLWAATSRPQIGSWDDTVAAIESHGVQPFARLDPDEVARRAGSSTHLAGVFEATGATVQPALLARGLRRAALARGVRIFERSPMTRLGRGRPPRIDTPLGSVSAERVVLAMNAWLVQVKELSSSLVVVGSDIVATDPIPDRLAEIGLTDGVAISDSRLLVNYYRTTLDGRIAFGQGGGRLGRGGKIGAAFHGVPAADRARHVTASFHQLYPALADIQAPTVWTGPIDRSHSGLPLFGRLGGRPDIVFGGGFSGNGVGPAAVAGRILASLTLGLDDRYADAGLRLPPHGGFPPEPVKYLGGRVVRAAVERKERADDHDRRADPLTRLAAGFAPAGLVPTRKPAKD